MQARCDFGSLNGELLKAMTRWNARVGAKDRMSDTLTNTAFNGGKFRVPDHLYDEESTHTAPDGRPSSSAASCTYTRATSATARRCS